MAQYAALMLGGINFIMSTVSLVLVERLGRRTLHLYGLALGFISLTLLSAFLILKVLACLVKNSLQQVVI